MACMHEKLYRSSQAYPKRLYYTASATTCTGGAAQESGANGACKLQYTRGPLATINQHHKQTP
jgi:uncharacterized protein (DUF169 family)